MKRMLLGVVGGALGLLTSVRAVDAAATRAEKCAAAELKAAGTGRHVRVPGGCQRSLRGGIRQGRGEGLRHGGRPGRNRGPGGQIRRGPPRHGDRRRPRLNPSRAT